MSDDLQVLAEYVTPAPPAQGAPASFDTATVTEVVDATHVKVDLGDKQVTAHVPATESGTAEVGSTVRVSTQENTYTMEGVLQGATAGTAPVGAIVMWATTTIPDGWLKLDGSTYSSTDYPQLFAILGTTTLPNMADRAPVGTSGTKTIKSTGGAATVTLTEAQLPSHDHSMTHTHSLSAHTHDMTHTHTMAHTHNMAHVHGTRAGVHSVEYASGTVALPMGDTGNTGTGFQTGASSATNTGGSSAANTGGPNDTTTGTPSNDSTGASSAANTGTAGSGSAVTVQNPYLALNFIIKAR